MSIHVRYFILSFLVASAVVHFKEVTLMLFTHCLLCLQLGAWVCVGFFFCGGGHGVLSCYAVILLVA